MPQTLKRRQLYRKRTKRSKCRSHKPISKKRCAAKKGCRRTKRTKRARAYCRSVKNKRHPGRPRRVRRGGGCGCGLQAGGDGTTHFMSSGSPLGRALDA